MSSGYCAPDAACGNFATTLSWGAITGAASYSVTAGVTIGGTDLADNVDAGSALTYDINADANATIYYTVVAVNSAGVSSGCTEGSFTTFATGCYCDSDTTSVDGTGITNLQVGSTDFASGGTLGYEDFTGAPVDLGQGITSNVQITYATGYDYGVNIWIDFNDNYTFEVSEQVFTDGLTAGASPTTFDASFTMPAAAVLGTHRMRISSDDTPAQATACNMSTYHVTMDVDVNIITPSCNAPTGTATLVTDCDNAQFSVDVNITGLGDGTSQINDGTTTYSATTLGIVTVGPYTDASSVTLILENGTDPTCDINLGTFTYTCPPANDDCANATAITMFSNGDTQDASGATNNAGFIADCGFGMNDGVWYSFTVVNAGTINVDVTGVTGWDPEVALYSGSCGAFTCTTYADDNGGGVGESVSFTATAATKYWVNIGYYAGSSDASEGPLTINVTSPDTATLSAALSTQDINANGLAFTYYPNPVNNTLTLKSQKEISNVTVFNMLGQEVIRIAPNAVSKVVDMSNLQSGAYFLQVTIGSTVETVRVIKN